jgi:hypothetical protein
LDFSIKENDLLPTLDATLSDEAGPIDLQGSTILFIMSTGTGATPKVSATASSMQVGDGSDGSKGKVRYSWVEGDTDETGSYIAEFEVTVSGGKKLTVPNRGYIRVRIIPDLN